MRVYYCAAKQDLILRSPPKAGISKDGHEGTATTCDSPALAGEGWGGGISTIENLRGERTPTRRKRERRSESAERSHQPKIITAYATQMSATATFWNKCGEATAEAG